jgi:hypothetical protein
MDGYPELHATDRHAAFSLRPLTTGEVIDRTLALFRRHFWLFTGIALGPALVSLLFSVFSLILRHILHLPMQTGAFSNPKLAILTVISSVVTLAIYGCSQAASTAAVSSVYLGNETTVKSSYKISFEHWVRYPLLILAQLVSAGWVTIVGYAMLLGMLLESKKLGMTTNAPIVGLIFIVILLSFPYSIYRYVKISLAIPGAVVEGLPIRASLKRSNALLVDRKGRIFMVFILMGILYMILGVALAITLSFAMRGQIKMIVAQIITLLSGFLASALLQPIGAIALCLFYFDERVRREGFDIEFMLQSVTASQSGGETLTPLDHSIEA